MTTSQGNPVVRIETDDPSYADLASLMEDYLYTDQTIKELEGLKAAKQEALRGWVERARETLPGAVVEVEMEDGARRVGLYQNKGRREIKAELLAQQGVGLDVIEAATVEGPPSKEFVRVMKVGKKDNG